MLRLVVWVTGTLVLLIGMCVVSVFNLFTSVNCSNFVVVRLFCFVFVFICFFLF